MVGPTWEELGWSLGHCVVSHTHTRAVVLDKISVVEAFLASHLLLTHGGLIMWQGH